MINIDVVVENIKALKGLKVDKEVADLMGLSAADFSNRKKRGTLLPLVLEWAVEEDVSLDWLTTDYSETPGGGISQVVTGDGNIQAGGSVQTTAGARIMKLHGRLDPEVVEICELLQQYGSKPLLASFKEKLLKIKELSEG